MASGATPTLAEVYRAHVDFVVRSTRHLGVHEAQVEDVVHDVFLVVHRRLRDFDGRGSMKSWLYGITRRVVQHHRRGDSRARAREAHAPPPSPALEVTDQFEQRETARAVEACLRALDDDQRLIFVLADIEGMTAPQIARAHGIKLNTVYSRLRLARRRFERALARALDAAEQEVGRR